MFKKFFPLFQTFAVVRTAGWIVLSALGTGWSRRLRVDACRNDIFYLYSLVSQGHTEMGLIPFSQRVSD